jgi:hypothetical protein
MLDLRGRFDGVSLMRPVARLGKYRQLRVWQFAIQDPDVFEREEWFFIA